MVAAFLKSRGETDLSCVVDILHIHHDMAPLLCGGSAGGNGNAGRGDGPSSSASFVPAEFVVKHGLLPVNGDA